MYDNLAVLAVFAFMFSVVAGRIERSTITGPIILAEANTLIGPNIVLTK
jgi:hypothetical protein